MDGRERERQLLRCATFDMIRCKFRGMASLGIWAKLTVPFRVLPCQLWNGTLMNSFNILKLLAKKKRLLAVKQ
ncbi:MAG: hypothetical protein U9N60_12000 [Thermodesulfobacteriota bacterium]|nr:hypothetical protein [Thermodesulfobacteriota bacterium]